MGKSITQKAAIGATVVLAGLSIFQLLLALGFPFGRAAWGGAHMVLPTSLRLGSLISILIYSLAGYIVLARAGLLKASTTSRLVRYGTWFFTVLFSVGVLLNLVSPSSSERYQAVVALTLAILFFIVAKGK